MNYTDNQAKKHTPCFLRNLVGFVNGTSFFCTFIEDARDFPLWPSPFHCGRHSVWKGFFTLSL